MADIDPIVISYAVTAAEFGLLTVLLVVGAWRNHFKQHKTRPVILSLAFLCSATGVQSGMRVATAYMRTTGNVAAFYDLLQSGVWFWSNVLAAVAGAALVFTLLLAYPESRRPTG